MQENDVVERACRAFRDVYFSGHVGDEIIEHLREPMKAAIAVLAITYRMPDGRPVFGEGSPHDIGEHLKAACASPLGIRFEVPKSEPNLRPSTFFEGDVATHKDTVGSATIAPDGAETAPPLTSPAKPFSDGWIERQVADAQAGFEKTWGGERSSGISVLDRAFLEWITLAPLTLGALRDIRNEARKRIEGAPEPVSGVPTKEDILDAYGAVWDGTEWSRVSRDAQRTLSALETITAFISMTKGSCRSEIPDTEGELTTLIYGEIPIEIKPEIAAKAADQVFTALRPYLRQPAPDDELERLKDIVQDWEEVSAQQDRLVRELDVVLNGADGAAKQASLCDIVSQVKATKRESNDNWKRMRGLPMSAIKVGMKLKDTHSSVRPVITVTEITDKGFKYTHSPHNLGSRIGVTHGGECYGSEGYSLYTEIEGGQS